MPLSFFKVVENVYPDINDSFSFNEVNYEITEKDIQFLKEHQLGISYDEFEKVIDFFEKIVQSENKQS